ncbi:hypothetical protein ACETK8_20640 (plasmid) [Brevundimonas staleyi]|uniref:Benenodin family lasso peptide n=1 Tax=Brevundimonas staleyi TaxID=74326 RepID=A0ABW0FRR0_9CAUL
MTKQDLIELDDDAQFIDLGEISVETLGDEGSRPEGSQTSL